MSCSTAEGMYCRSFRRVVPCGCGGFDTIIVPCLHERLRLDVHWGTCINEALIEKCYYGLG